MTVSTSAPAGQRRRWLGFLLAGLTLLALWGVPKLLLPSYTMPSGLIPAEGTYDVRILRDTWGVPHIFGKRDADVAYGLAWAHAEDDFATIQDVLLASRGQLGLVYGPDLAPNDYMVQLLRIEQIVEEGYPTLRPSTRAILEAYADGINHYAATHPDEAHAMLYPARGHDLVAGFVHKVPLFFGLDTALKDIFADQRQHEVGGGQQASVGPGPRDAFPDMHGSNVMAVAPGRTEDGSTYLAINSHQPWTGPVAWYEVHLKSEEGWDMVGGVFPGAPVVLHGHNRHLGWAHTVNRPDLLDVYVLETDESGENYLLDGVWMPFERGTASFDVKLLKFFRWNVKRPLLHSVHGPVVERPHGTYALRFSGYGNVGHIEQWFRMNKATTWDAWQDAMAELSIPMFNTGYADQDGNIHYLYNARLPERQAGWDYSGYLPGGEARTLWQDEPWPLHALPQVKNPPCGYIVNANNAPSVATCPESNPQSESYPFAGSMERHMTNRGLRLSRLLQADPRISWDDFMAIKFDTAYAQDSDMAKLVRRVLELPTDEDLAEARDVLAAWNLDTDADNPHAALAILAFGTYMLPDAEMPDDEALMKDVRRAVEILETYHGGLEVPWKDVNRLSRGDVDLGVAGGPDIAHAVYGELDESTGRLVGTAGDSYVLMVRWDEDGNVHSESLHQFGSATLDETSPHYADQATLFAEKRLKPVWMDEVEIRQNLAREYRPGDVD